MMIKSIFRAIAYGSSDAKVYIPYILQLDDLKNNRLTAEFNEALNMVPEWMFIAYISQMLSNYDFENECFLDVLLLKLANKYPNGKCIQNLLMVLFLLTSQSPFSFLFPLQTVAQSLPEHDGKPRHGKGTCGNA